MASPLTSGLDIGSALAQRIINTQLAQKEHERLQEQSEQQKARDEFNQRMKQLATMIQLQNLGARRATEMDNAEIAIGKVAKPEGIVPSTLGEQLFSGGEGIGDWILPTQEEIDTRAVNLKRREEGVTTEAEAARGRAEMEQKLELSRRVMEATGVPIGGGAAELLGISPGTKIPAENIDDLLRYMREPEPNGADFVTFTDDQGNVSVMNRTTGQITAKQPGIGRTTRASATEEGGGLTPGQQATQRRADRSELRNLEDEEYSPQGLHASLLYWGQILDDGKEPNGDKLTKARRKFYESQIRIGQQRLRNIYKRKLELRAITREQYNQMIADLDRQQTGATGGGASASPRATTEGPNNGNPYR